MYNISKHAQQRYAERIMEKEDTSDIGVFIAQQQEKINEDINKMIEYGEEIYTGKANDKNVCTVIIKDTWVVLVDKEKNVVITLYKIDFGVGDDFNQEYIRKMREKLDKAIETCEQEKKQISNNVDEYRSIIETNENTITEYTKTIKSLKEQNEMFQGIINSMKTNADIAEKEVRDIVSKLTGRK